MPDILRSKDFQNLSGRQFELCKLLLLIMVNDFQVHDFCQKMHCVREVARADTGSRFGCELQGNLLRSDLICFPSGEISRCLFILTMATRRQCKALLAVAGPAGMRGPPRDIALADPEGWYVQHHRPSAG